MTIPSIDWPTRRCPLTASLFSDAATYDTDLALHPSTIYIRPHGYVPRWFVLLFEFADDTGSESAFALRATLNGCDDTQAYEDTLARRSAQILAQSYVTATVASVQSELGEHPLNALWELLGGTGDHHETVKYRIREAASLAKATRVKYPGGRRGSAGRSADGEYLARCAEALCVWEEPVHGKWPRLSTGSLRQRILSLSVHLAAKRWAAICSESGQSHYARASREEIPFLLNACVIANTLRDCPDATWTARRAAYAARWNRVFLALTGAYGDDWKGALESWPRRV